MTPLTFVKFIVCINWIQLLLVSGSYGTPSHHFKIFNAIQSTLRLWDSAWNHNGMSIFLATIPPGTKLHHGSSSSAPIIGLSWLAFDIRHALMFVKAPGAASFASSINGSSWAETQSDLQRMLQDKPGPAIGWQHEYTTVRTLRVVYFDGLAAAKTSMGTMDLQDILLGRTGSEKRMSDSERAEQLCELLQKKWNTNVDGIIRMEHGIEVVLCNATSDLLAPTRISKREIAHAGERSMQVDADGLEELFRTAFARDRDFGRTRANLHFETMVSGFSYFRPEDLSERPLRLFGASQQQLDQFRSHVQEMVGTDSVALDTRSRLDWQTVTDMVISQYADVLLRLASIEDAGTLTREVEAILWPFFDYDQDIPSIDIVSCASEHIPASYEPSLASDAVLTVATSICETLASLLKSGDDIATSQGVLRDFMAELDWSKWRKCGDCSPGEFCWIPVWPFGSVADRDSPKCGREVSIEFVNRYWR
ncbi:hypothetical protein BDW02DRAFT_386482 [Decorospora gaudefroyi]|uniref:Uncharacterized protein n=1 Tax=Decorospora gaudefroyi TaxID=184978 RepID=A0A6A5KD44_9PLEO|nr:hypothetical protein BDW02DRAFT_386482 [Decorospora gaudefroyi]